MLLLIPLSCFLIFNFMRNGKNNFSKFLVSICLTFGYLYAVTEILSLFNAVSEISIKCCWIIFLIIFIIANIYKLIKNKQKNGNKSKIKFKEIIKKVKIKYILVTLIIIGFIVIGINTIPYNYDSMTYHLPRIMHWIQNGTIDHYATNIVRQLTSPIFAEVADMHIYLLSDSNEIFMNLLQTISFIINAFIVYFIAEKIGCDKKFSTMAFILAISMPIGVAEAFSTQVDNFAALWCLIFTYFILDYLKKEEKISIDKENIIKLLCIGICLGFGYLTKPTVLFSDAIFTLYLFFMCIRRKDKFKNILISIIIVGITAGILIVPTTIRNLKTFNAFSDPIAGQKQIVQVERKKYFVVNFLKNLLWNYQTNIVEQNNKNIKDMLNEAADKFEVDLNDESISEAGREFDISGNMIYHHDYAVNPLIMWSLTFAIIIFSINIKYIISNKEKKSIMYVILSIISFIVFISIMRFQVWETRYEISFLALLCPAISLLFNISLKENQQKYIIGAIFYIAIISMIVQYYYHTNIISEIEEKNKGYFISNKTLYEDYFEICEVINEANIKEVGIEVTEDTYEYPFYVMTKDDVKIEHISVQNSSKIYYNENYNPEIIVSNTSNDDNKIYNNKEYRKIKTVNLYSIYEIIK